MGQSSDIYIRSERVNGHAGTESHSFPDAFMEKTMILGLGLDVVEMSRINRVWIRFGLSFANRILHPDEIARLNAMTGSRVQFLASRFAAKEAVVKSLGTGFSQGVLPVDIVVDTLPGGGPKLRLHGGALARMRMIGATSAHISLTHGKETVAAVVIFEG